MASSTTPRNPGPYLPTLIIHGGAGSITRSNLPPSLYEKYRRSLLTYLRSTHALLTSPKSPATALEAAVHAVALMEDDPLFNCGRGSVFTERGTVEMEASLMCASVCPDPSTDPDNPPFRPVKRGAAVSLVRNTRHPIKLVREVLLAGGDGMGGTGSMHCQLSGRELEEWGWRERGLDRVSDEWFWTERRWKEHLRGLDRPTPRGEGERGEEAGDMEGADPNLPSQGTVGAVCMDCWGDLAVATSTGGLTNKKPGRIGDTPTLGAGFWAEDWAEDLRPEDRSYRRLNAEGARMPTSFVDRISRAFNEGFATIVGDCLPFLPQDSGHEPLRIPGPRPPPYHAPSSFEKRAEPVLGSPETSFHPPPPDQISTSPPPRPARRAVAVSGTGNGDSFLRTSGARTAAAMCRFSFATGSLSKAVTAIAGPGGELQLSAGDRWNKTGEGQGGIIGIEACEGDPRGRVVADFNCGGMWRAWIDGKTRDERVMVFKDEYEPQS